MSIKFSNSKIFNGINKQIAVVDYHLVNEDSSSISIIGKHPDNEDMTIYMSNDLHKVFIKKILNSPVRKFNCLVKSYQNIIVNNYKDDRISNDTGNLQMNDFKPELFSQLKIYDNKPDEEVFVFINDLHGYNKILNNRGEVFCKDLELLGDLTKLKKINLIVNKKYQDIFFSYGEIFRSINFFENYDTGIQMFLETKFGIKITTEISQFSHTFQMNPDASIETIISTGLSKVNARSRGRFDFIGSKVNEKGSLILIGTNIKNLDDELFELPLFSSDFTPSGLNKLLRYYELVNNLPKEKIHYRNFLTDNMDLVLDKLLNENEIVFKKSSPISEKISDLYKKLVDQFDDFINNIQYSGISTPTRKLTGNFYKNMYGNDIHDDDIHMGHMMSAPPMGHNPFKKY